MNADAKNTIPDQGGAEAMQADSIAIPTKVEGSETVAVYIKAGTEKQMSEYVDVLERTKQKLRERGLEYHDVKFGGGTVTGLLGVSMPKTGEARDTYEKEFDILKFTVESTRSRAPVWPNEVSDGVIGSVAQEIAVAVKCAPNGIDVRGGFECSAGKVDEAKFKGGGLFAVNAKKSEFKEMLARLQGSDYGKLKHFSLEEGGPGLRVGAGNWSVEWDDWEPSVTMDIYAVVFGFDNDEYEDEFASGRPQGFIRDRLGPAAVVTRVLNYPGFEKAKKVKMQVPIHAVAEVRAGLKDMSEHAKKGGRYKVDEDPCIIVELGASVKAYKAVYNKEPAERGQRDAVQQAVLLSRLAGMESETAARAAARRAAGVEGRGRRDGAGVGGDVGLDNLVSHGRRRRGAAARGGQVPGGAGEASGRA